MKAIAMALAVVFWWDLAGITVWASDCISPVSVDCTDTKGTPAPEDDEECELYVALADLPGECVNEGDADRPNLTNLNRLIAQIISSLTAGLPRLPGEASIRP